MEQNQKKALSNFDHQWINLVDKAFNHFNALTPHERIWFTIAGLIDSTDNGGLIAHYYNEGANHNTETIADLESLGFADVADMLRSINQLFPNGDVPTNLDARNDIIHSWPYNENEDLLEDLDQDFNKREKALEAALLNHIQTKIVSKN